MLCAHEVQVSRRRSTGIAEKGVNQKSHLGALQDAGHRGRVLELQAVPAITDAVGGLVHVDTVDQW